MLAWHKSPPPSAPGRLCLHGVQPMDGRRKKLAVVHAAMTASGSAPMACRSAMASGSSLSVDGEAGGVLERRDGVIS